MSFFEDLTNKTPEFIVMFFSDFEMNKKYSFRIENIFSPTDSDFHRNGIGYVVYKATTMQHDTALNIPKGVKMTIHFARKSWIRALGVVISNFSAQGINFDEQKEYDTFVQFRRINKNVMVIDKFEITDGEDIWKI